MNITAKHLFVKKVTIQYPDQKFTMPPKARNRLALDMVKCTGCTACAKACPVNCIDIETIRVMADDPHQELLHTGKERKLWLGRFDIDFAKCCYCSLCVVACPSDAINHSAEYEYSVYKREDLLYKFQTLTDEQVKDKQARLAEFMAIEKVCHPDDAPAKPVAKKNIDEKTE